MTQHNLTQILKVIRDLVMRNRPCYRDYLGKETVTKTVQIGTGTFAANSGNALAQFPAVDSAFTGFVLGETYTVAIDGVAADYVARNLSPISEQAGPVIGTATAFDMETDTFDGWLAAVSHTPEGLVCFAQTYDTSFIGKTISISQTKTETVKRYKTKLLPEYLLPAFLRKNVVASKAEVQSAAAKATAAADAANTAQSTANTAQTTADAAQSTANTAKSTADAAQTTANAAQTTANTALGRTEEPYNSTAYTALMTRMGAVSGWFAALYWLDYNPTEGYFKRDYLSDAKMGYDDIAQKFLCQKNKNALGANPSALKLLNVEGAGGSNYWRIGGIAIGDDGALYSVSSNEVSRYTKTGLFLTFTPYKSIVLSSSTANSDKQFRITVDDTGTLKATEVT